MTIQRPDLRIPKYPVAVELNLDGGGIREVDVFVADHLDDGYRRQHVADLLATAEKFHPVRDLTDQSWFLFNKAITIWIRIPLSGGVLPIEEVEQGLPVELFEQQATISVEMAGGQSISGELFYSLPARRARVVDYLNSCGRFFRLWTSAHLYLVNISYVACVIEKDHANTPGDSSA